LLAALPQDGIAERLERLVPTCAADPAAAREIEAVLAGLAPALRGGALDTALARPVVGAALALALAGIADEEREFDVETCFELAGLAAGAHAERAHAAELAASVALSRSGYLSERGRIDEAQAELERILLDDPAPVHLGPRLRVELADLLRFCGDLDAAESLLAEARALLDALPEGDPERASAGLRLELAMGRLQLDLGCIDIAWSAYRRARVLAAGLSESERALQRLEEAALLLASDDFARAEALADELLASPALPPELEAPALYRRGLARWVAARGAGKGTAGAEADLRAALARGLPAPESATCRLRLAEMDLAAGELEEARAGLAQVRRALASRDAATRTRGQSMEAALLAALEARALRTLGADRALLEAARLELRARHADLLEEWRRLDLREGGVGFLHFGVRSEALGELVALELALEGPARGAEVAFELLVEAQQLGSLARRMDLGTPTLAQVRASLPERGVLLAYLLTPRSGWLLAVDARGVEAHPLEGRWTLRAPLERFATLLMTSPADLGLSRRSTHAVEVDRLARDLRRRLVPDDVLARVLAAKSATVVSESQLSRVAFEALRLPDGRWMGCAAAVDHWPSVPVGVDLLRRSSATAAAERPTVLGFAAPLHAGALGEPLRLDAAQRHSLESAWPGLELWTGREASVSRLRTADLAHARALLFLVHATEDAERALHLGMVLASEPDADGVLWSEEVASAARVELPLVVLGVCGAGRGPQRLGEDGAAHLGGAWIRRGALCVVQSAFDLEESSTRAQIVALGQGLVRGESVAEALRAARCALAHERPEEPYYHQLLQAVGAGQLADAR
jgi:hypothetical protein